MENRPEREERMEEAPAPGAEANSEEPTAGLEHSAGTMELQQGGEDEAPAASRRHTEVLALPKVDRGAAPATPAIRPGPERPLRLLQEPRVEQNGSKKRRLPGKKRSGTSEQRSLQGRLRKLKRRSLKEPLRRRQFEGSWMLPWRTQAVLNRYFYSKGSIKHFSETHRTDRISTSLSIGLSRISDISPVQYSAPRRAPAGEEERVKLTKLREEEEEAEDAEAAKKAAAGVEEADEGSASRKRKLEELEEKKRVLEEEIRKRKELEDESRRLRAVEEAERRAREQRSNNPKLQVPVAAEMAEKGEAWFERKATELVESYIQAYGPQQKKSKEAAATYASACKDSEQAQENFISALQKTQESAEQLQKSMGKALEAAIEFGREEERDQLYTQAKEKCSRPEVPRVKAKPQIPAGLQEKLRKEKSQKEEESSKSGKKEGPGVPTSAQPGPFWGARAREQPAEEEPGKEWHEKISEDTWKAGRTIRSDEKYLECTYYPFSPEWQEKLRKELLDLAHRGLATNADGELYPTRRFGWQLQSTREFQSINKSLERDYGIRLVWKSQEVKGKSKSVDDWHCYPIGRGKMEKTTRFGVQYTVLGSLPPNKSMCSICWSEGHWKSECRLKEMVFELWEPALTVLVPAERLRKYFPCRNIICERFQHEKDEYQRFYPAVAFADYGAVSSQISEINAKKYKDAKLRSPEEYPEIEPPEDERGERPVLSAEEAIPYAASKKAAKPSDPEQSMASHSEAPLEMQDSAKKRRAKLLEKESKQKAIDVDDESTSKKEESASKKARGKGQGSPSGIWTKEPLPA